MDVSVIIPVYNAEKYIKKTIESCLRLPEVKEIVVVDDGYKDRSKEIVAEMAKMNPIIKLYEHPNNENRGAGMSRNLGILKATQKYIAFLDADDYFSSNRFVKDKDVLENNPDADGSYNAIGCYFYSELAKKKYLKYFPSTITTVNSSVNPTPNNLFKGLLGMISNYGYFHLDGLTVKRDSLLKNQIFFPSLKLHQDTVFIFQLAYYTRLYAAEIDIPVAYRGVHEENRITANFQIEKIKNHNKYLFWKYLLDWAKKEKIDKEILSFFKRQKSVYNLLSDELPKPIKLIIGILKNPKIILDSKYRDLHTMYLGNSSITNFFLKIRKMLGFFCRSIGKIKA